MRADGNLLSRAASVGEEVGSNEYNHQTRDSSVLYPWSSDLHWQQEMSGLTILSLKWKISIEGGVKGVTVDLDKASAICRWR